MRPPGASVGFRLARETGGTGFDTNFDIVALFTM
jgi:hypothetical protein